MLKPVQPTIRTLAARIGLACSTVSRALRNHPRISAATRARVLEEARRLGYTVNPLASSVMSHMRRGESSRCRGKIAWISLVPSNEIENIPWLRGIHQGASKRAAQTGFLFEDFWLNPQAFPRDRLTPILQARGIQGLVIPSCHPYLDDLQWEHFASAITMTPLHVPPLHMAGADHVNGMRLAVRELHKRDYARIGLMLHPLHDRTRLGADRAAFLLETADAPVRTRVPILWLPEDSTEDEQIECFGRWVQRHQPDVVLSLDQRLITWAHALGIDVPGRLGLILLSRHAHLTQWAGIDHHEDQIGAAAVDLVTGQLFHGEYGIPLVRKQVLIAGSLAEGPTIRPPAAQVKQVMAGGE